jgi:hypothetical protein
MKLNKKNLSTLSLICAAFLLLSALPGCKQKTHNQTDELLIMPETPLNIDPITTMPAAEPIAMLSDIPSMPIGNDALQNVSQQKQLNANTFEIKEKSDTHNSNNPKELDFDVENKTGKTVYVTCFVYQRKRAFGRWRWDKSKIYQINNNQTVTVDVDSIPDEQDRNAVFGYLGVFKSEAEANDATYELTKEQNLMDLDLLIKLKGKKVTLLVEKYGHKGEIFEYDFVNKDGSVGPSDELDFAIENKTGKPIFVTCFVYQKKAKGSWLASLEEKDDMAVWRFDKTPIVHLMPDQTGIIDVDTIVTERDREYVRGYLAVFDQDEENLAYQSTFESLETSRKLHMGELHRLKNKKIIIDVEKYGAMEDFIDFVIKPASKIDFKKVQ